MRKYLYLTALIFISSATLIAQSSFGFSFMGAAPTGSIHHQFGYGVGINLNYESNSLFKVSKNLPVSMIGSVDAFEVGYFDEVQDAAMPSTPERLSSICVMNTTAGLNFGGRISANYIPRLRLYADVFSSVRAYHITASYHPYFDGGSIEDEVQTLYTKVLPQIGIASGVQYQVSKIIGLNLRFSYATGGPVKLANANNYSTEENKMVTFNLEERPNSNIFTFEFGVVARLSDLRKDLIK